MNLRSYLKEKINKLIINFKCFKSYLKYTKNILNFCLGKNIVYDCTGLLNQ